MNSKKVPLRILFVEDSPDDAQLIMLQLELAGVVATYQRVDTEAAFIAALDATPDLILSDYALPQFDGLHALRLLTERGLDIPFILISGMVGEELAVEAIKQGADDYLLKDRLGRLGPAIQHTLEQKRLRLGRIRADKALRESEARFRVMADSAPVLIWLSGPDKRCTYFNKRWLDFTGRTLEQEVGNGWTEGIHPDDLDRCLQTYVTAFDALWTYRMEYRLRRYDGEYRWVVSDGSPLFTGDEFTGYIGSCFDITERKRAEEQLRLQSAALEATANTIVITDHTGIIQWVNPAFTQLTGYTLSEAIGNDLGDLVKSDQQSRGIYEELWATILAGQPWQGELVNHRKDGSLYIEEQTITPLRDESGEITHFIAIKQDITARKQLEAENEQLAAQFYQAQKMESIGRLAGGIAHDFNNLLVPIVGYTELGMLELASDSQLYADLKRIKEAGERATGLTRQILAFSRQQVLEMKILDLNQVISEFEPMLGRLIGEDIALQTHLAVPLLPIKADKGQLEQVLLNLVINARDAMPDGGRLVIETAQVALDETYVTKDTDTQPGPHALLAVSDTGHGMDAATQQRIFEPFFTTKVRGQGTGLGMATVFGIVKQHSGSIWIYSEPGQGTTFKIFLPLAQAPVSITEPERPEAGSLDGTETVLVVEDDASVRQLVVDMLRAHGYWVLSTEDPAEGLKLATAHRSTIHLLLTDVIMPVMNGRELYRQLVAERPDLKVLYMSGYTDNVIAHHHVLDEELAFLQKPFTIRGLLQKVRAVLG